MSKIKAIIVDDERRARNVLASLLERSCPEVDVVAECSNVPDAVEEINRLCPDVVFLDVQMPNYAGYEIVNFFEKIDFEIIFVTAYDHYAMKAFELNAIDYLIKPVNRIRLKEAVNKMEVRFKEQKQLSDYASLLETLKEKEFKQIVIPQLGDRRVLQLREIIAIEAEGAYSNVYLEGGHSIVVSKALKYFEEVLPEDLDFFRAHRGWIVNLKHLKSFNKSEGTMTLLDNVTSKISRNKVADLEKAMH